eukprot:CAMPEP_0114295996 /NCGR_PEP_ID=MMETSP0059-20121206/11072_1 /TAXON_ID=36894 /ORGANISM="Pyramimonas parkeae, Strain CCMP726" /LENGTH=49 /DNA_ID= /DNA_START= /DNA_END= /DNA_ORIENTATION=
MEYLDVETERSSKIKITTFVICTLVHGGEIPFPIYMVTRDEKVASRFGM